MKQLPYGSSAAPLRFEFPTEWPAEDITAISLTVYDRSNNVLQAADNITLWAATTLNGAVSRYADAITLAAGATDLSQGDPILVKGVEGDEYPTVKGWDTSTKIATLEMQLDNEYADGDAVHGLFGDYELDLSDTDTYTAGIVLRLVWTPTGGGQAVTWMSQVSKTALDISGLRGDFENVYPRAYSAFTQPDEKFERMAAVAEQQMTAQLMADGFDIQRIVDQELIKPALMAKMAILWTLAGDEDKEDERKIYAGEYSSQIGWIKKLPVWTDVNQDGIETTDELQTHVTRFDGPRRW